jgi:hypothetical protein
MWARNLDGCDVDFAVVWIESETLARQFRHLVSGYYSSLSTLISCLILKTSCIVRASKFDQGLEVISCDSLFGCRNPDVVGSGYLGIRHLGG